jgi:hypothetical protein
MSYSCTAIATFERTISKEERFILVHGVRVIGSWLSVVFKGMPPIPTSSN